MVRSNKNIGVQTIQIKKLISKEARNLTSTTAILKQVLSDQTAKRDVMSLYLKLEVQLAQYKYAFKLFLSVFFVCVKMPCCSTPGRSNRSDRDPEKTFKFT